jgi:CheY-like chemotaxis protein
MTQEIIEEIFDPFFTTKEVGKGTGLGLSTAMAIVKGHGGDMRVSSELGLGSRFMIYIPAVDELAALPAPSAVSAPARGNGEVLLVVDDEESIREVALRTLEANGYRVLLAANGFEALAIFQESPESIHVVLTDMMMPIMDGPALIKSLKRLAPQVKIIGASGMADHELVTQVMDAGIAEFLDKPYSLDTLLAALSRVITDSPRDFKVS